MKILMLVNWKVTYCREIPEDKQPPDYYVDNRQTPYWFYRYFENIPDVDVIDVSSFPWLEHFEKEKLRFYVWQTLRAIPKLRKYDLIVSHGMQSGVVLSLWRRLFHTKAKHIVFDIGSFNSAAEQGVALKLMQCASKSIDGIIYHTSTQKDYYHRFFPWVEEKSRFIRFGTDVDFFDKASNQPTGQESDDYILCVGYSKRDWDTVIKAYSNVDTDVKLRLVGHVDDQYRSIKNVEQIPFVPIKEVISQIANARFCVLPLKSFNYSYGQMTLMQQMALGKCVIAARVPSLIDYIEDGKNAIMYEPGITEDLSQVMTKLLKDQSLADRIGENGRRFIKEICNEKTMAAEIEKYYKEVRGQMACMSTHW